MNKRIECFGLVANLIEDKINFDNNNQKHYCSAHEFYLEVDNVAKYYVDALNNNIFIERHPNLVDSAPIDTWLYGSVYAYLLQHNGYLVLHGSAIMANDSAIIFSGNSGAGKSTLATEFISRGYKLLTDDVVVITENKESELVMIPGMSKVKLWQNALENFGKSNIGLKQIFNKAKKYELPVALHQSTPIKIKAFYELNHTDESDTISIEEIIETKKVNLLIHNTYRYAMLKSLKNGLKNHLKQISKLAKTINTYRVIRPNHKYLLSELANKIESQFLL